VLCHARQTDASIFVIGERPAIVGRRSGTCPNTCQYRERYHTKKTSLGVKYHLMTFVATYGPSPSQRFVPTSESVSCPHCGKQLHLFACRFEAARISDGDLQSMAVSAKERVWQNLLLFCNDGPHHVEVVDVVPMRSSQ